VKVNFTTFYSFSSIALFWFSKIVRHTHNPDLFYTFTPRQQTGSAHLFLWDHRIGFKRTAQKMCPTPRLPLADFSGFNVSRTDNKVVLGNTEHIWVYDNQANLIAETDTGKQTAFSGIYANIIACPVQGSINFYDLNEGLSKPAFQYPLSYSVPCKLPNSTNSLHFIPKLNAACFGITASTITEFLWKLFPFLSCLLN